jgi:hypothetical protein
LQGAAVTNDSAAELELLDDAVRADYVQGDVVLVDGWLLSRTEARLYALVTLVSRTGPQDEVAE